MLSGEAHEPMLNGLQESVGAATVFSYETYYDNLSQSSVHNSTHVDPFIRKMLQQCEWSLSLMHQPQFYYTFSDWWQNNVPGSMKWQDLLMGTRNALNKYVFGSARYTHDQKVLFAQAMVGVFHVLEKDDYPQATKFLIGWLSNIPLEED